MLIAKSSVDWMKEIPEGWQVKRIRDIFTFGKGLAITKADLVEKGIPVISYGQIHAKSNTGVHLKDELLRFVDESYLTTGFSSKLQYGDIVFADTSEDTEGIGNCVFIDRKDIVMAGYHTLIARTKLPEYAKYLAYLFKSECWRDQLRSVANGIKVFSITQKMLKACTVVLPSAEYSNKVVSFLDSTCSDIDTAITEAKASIEDYKLLKQSIITKAVTKGLNPNVPMKISEIEWIGEIPEHWDITKLSQISRNIQNGYVGPTRDLFVDEGVKYIQSLHIKEGVIIFDKQEYYVTEEWANKHPKIYEGQLLFVQTGAQIGQVGLVDSKFDKCNCHALIIVSLNKQIVLPKFIMYYFLGHPGKELLLRTKTGALLPHLNSTRIGSIPISYPPYKEQEQISLFLDVKCSEINSLICEKEAMIADLEAYKKSLIFEVVTGKRKVC